MRILRPALVALALGAAVLVPGAAARGQSGFESKGGTRVSVSDPPIVDITVTIDVVVSRIDDPNLRAALDEMAAGIAEYWNDGFGDIGGCLVLNLAIEMNPVPESAVRTITVDGRETPVTTPGHHVVFWSGTGPSAPWPQTFDPYDTDQVAEPGEDASTPYAHELWAVWSGHLETTRDYAHEFGHLLGFGDDYRRSGLPIPERQGTLMDNGDKIDAALGARLAEIIRASGARLPGCWEGVLELSARYGSICRAHWTANVAVVLGDDETGRGETTLVLTSTDCPARVLAPRLEFEARRTGDSFDLSWQSTEQAQGVFGVAAGQGRVPLTSASRAEGTYENAYGSGEASTAFESTWTLTCSSCGGN